MEMKPVLVVGGGIAGIQAAVDIAEQGIKTYLVEKSPSIGGRMAQLDKTFPTLDCASCILTPKMVSVAKNDNLELLTYAEVEEVSGTAGDFTVKVLRKPRYVEMERCLGCGECITKCPMSVPDEFNLGMSKRKARF
jgi:heterodisulfide reductase subunit A